MGIPSTDYFSTVAKSDSKGWTAEEYSIIDLCAKFHFSDCSLWYLSLIHIFTMEPYQTEELERRPGIVGYIVKEGEELWTLAKRYCTTIDGICAVNGLTEDQVKPGDKILIFKENMSIL